MKINQTGIKSKINSKNQNKRKFNNKNKYRNLN